MDWKKDIKLGDIVGRKDDAGAATAEPVEGQDMPAAEGQPEKQQQSFWKRELRVRKPDEEGGKPARRELSRFAATPKPMHESEASAATEPAIDERRSRFTRFTRAGETDTSPAERKPSRFARPS